MSGEKRDKAEDHWLTSKQVAEALSVSEQTVRSWRMRKRDACPWYQVRRKVWFNPDELRTWLVDNGVCVEEEPPEPLEQSAELIMSHEDVALCFGVTTATSKNWKLLPDWPGFGVSQAYFAQWVINAGKGKHVPRSLWPGIAAQTPEARARLDEIKTQKAELELAQMRGTVIDAEEVIRFYTRTNNYAAGILRNLPSRILIEMPSDTSDVVLATVERVSKEVVQSAMESLQELIRGDEDELDEQELVSEEQTG